jgi:hypothetical protein
LETEAGAGPPSLSATDAVTLGAENTAEMDLAEQKSGKLPPAVQEKTKPHPPLPANPPSNPTGPDPDADRSRALGSVPHRE